MGEIPWWSPTNDDEIPEAVGPCGNRPGIARPPPLHSTPRSSPIACHPATALRDCETEDVFLTAAAAIPTAPDELCWPPCDTLLRRCKRPPAPRPHRRSASCSQATAGVHLASNPPKPRQKVGSRSVTARTTSTPPIAAFIASRASRPHARRRPSAPVALSDRAR
ncbi:hypothetical protein P154DRAFT_574486 [Amniculicola lignicola CBS 123094]|uniref:Uncharacterized protein n=1 Tax=Amniculicola lignicola CBS 123094 TaxID=1392246 RepID=A0A6A5WME4_9PLEO|nr:hypothetical protein P154DRAFT_574486 [Amniculicola lignicola CBS 123094]